MEPLYRSCAGLDVHKDTVVACVRRLAHTLLVIVWHVLSRRQPYAELGADYLDRREPTRVANRLVKRLERLGLKVTIEPLSAA